MSTEMFFFAGVALVSITAIVLFPFLDAIPDSVDTVRSRGTASRRQQYVYETLWAEKLRVLRALRDLDTDYDLRKLPDAIYTEQRLYLIRLYVALVQRLDELDAEIDAQQDRLEAALDTYRHSVMR